jgi:Membrane-associated phospholipid phosphatase
MLEQELLLEKDLFLQLNGSDSLFWDNFFYLYSYKWTWLLLYLCFLIVFIYKNRWKEILCVLLAVGMVVLLCDQISSGFFKPFFQRFRPTHHPEFKDLVDLVLNYRGGKYGFISSHAANAFGFFTFAILLFRNRIFTLCFVLFAILNGYSRIYLGVHFISDVVVGAMVGAIIGYFVYEGYNFVRRKWLKHPQKTLKQAVYPTKEAYFLCISYAVILGILLLFNRQLIQFFY